MSERLKNTRASDEESSKIIDELTKDLENNVNTQDETEFLVNPDSPEDIPSSSGVGGISDLPSKEEELDRDKTESDTDSIDEESLKDAEVDLTDDQKQERRIIAEQLKVAGNESYKVKDYDRSIEKYTEALKICPLQFSQLRSFLYCNRSAAKMAQQKYSSAAKDCTKAIELDDKYFKAYYRRAQSYEASDKLDESLADFKKMLELDPSHKEALKAITRLPPLIEAKNEKLKTEMLGKLKDLGNMLLRPFGLSTDNFQLEQDAESKGYKINFKQ
ncbi:tetratricopeptide repeat protein 1 [Plodia interpunctella]|uniref:tetratricopeptide repeat protein 1 n=1 Tax=Plodia interpunctella TaxID=58824 RepID=UPI002368BE54|nr:tetratricopeptide repeat protein 1 [Plodia interpunctella]XP_053610825.1 tetratricopeptide repeat protein 1 [Plodia interpunctella]XP_053610826.1 tetratricopeptide repeat protein 1 [Plodia interpunctella]XP_053610827.1 tetratricopeptide repeat protein 1 [Plodia interpunctella]XP_053610828.1 tetratricopeptide repeat protein 1 [Plodia interpunctella]XP_053610830.1 tetratricopeptide repeat protein 1 [Plodia interpunctella]XP_053610831.1 tetratricopeptide repeat protein 1 [Plodia interpunctell